MAKYTFELREVIDTFGRDEVKRWFMDYDLENYLTAEQIDVVTRNGVWSKENLADRIIEHFYTREIGTDAIGQFMLFIKDRLHTVMDTYLPLIYSAAIKYNPLNNMDYTETYQSTADSTSNSNASSTTSGLNVSSDTPQGQISKSAILNGSYASSTSANEGENESNGTSVTNDNQEFTRKLSGTSGQNQAEMIMKYRQTIRGLNSEIIRDLEPLFMGIY